MKKHKLELTIIEQDNGLWTVDIPLPLPDIVKGCEVLSHEHGCRLGLDIGRREPQFEGEVVGFPVSNPEVPDDNR